MPHVALLSVGRRKKNMVINREKWQGDSKKNALPLVAGVGTSGNKSESS